MDLNEVVSLIAAHKWLPLFVVVIAAMVRLMKSDVALPFEVAPRVRSWVALGLGVALGVVQALASGDPWLKALLDGLVAAFTAIAAHETIVESLRDGREFFASSGPAPKPPAAPGPGAAGLVLLVGCLAIAPAVTGCTPSERQAARTAVDIASVACVVLRGAVDGGHVEEICATEAELAPVVKRLVAGRAHPEACTVGASEPPKSSQP